MKCMNNKFTHIHIEIFFTPRLEKKIQILATHLLVFNKNKVPLKYQN
jgi:hypothetical protein